MDEERIGGVVKCLTKRVCVCISSTPVLGVEDDGNGSCHFGSGRRKGDIAGMMRKGTHGGVLLLLLLPIRRLLLLFVVGIAVVLLWLLLVHSSGWAATRNGA